MELLELMKCRRSIRKYQRRQISREDLEKIIEAGTYAPSAGGGQRSIIVGVKNAELAEKIGRLNVAKFDRTRLSGSYVSAEQPSIIDDPTMKSGFYGATATASHPVRTYKTIDAFSNRFMSIIFSATPKTDKSAFGIHTASPAFPPTTTREKGIYVPSIRRYIVQ